MGGNTGKVSGLLFADDTTLMAESESNLQKYISAFVRVCERRKLKINVGKSKVMKIAGTGEKCNMKKSERGGYERSGYFSVSDWNFASNGRMGAELNHRSMKVRKYSGVLKSV